MSSLYKRATPRQAIVLKMIEGAVRNAAHAHPGRSIDDQRIARSIAKRAAGTLTAQWPSVLAAPRVRSEGGDGYLIPRPATSGRQRVCTPPGKAVVSFGSHDRGGASACEDWRTPVRALHRAVGNECGNALRAGLSERHAALIDVLRMIGKTLEP